jgi:hypothetical protein
VRSDPCVDREARGTKDNENDDFYDWHRQPHHGACYPWGGRRHNHHPFDSFSSQQEFAELARSWPAKRLLSIWSSLPGVQPIRKFKNRRTAATRIWERIQGFAAPIPPQPAPPAKPKAERHAKGGAQSAQGAPAKGKAAHKASAAKNVTRAKKSAPVPEVTAPRQGSKTAQVVAMLRRKNGATLSEIMKTMGWQKHTVRGFMAGAMKKAGHAVESFKPEGGERTYRLCGAPHNL